MKDDRVYLEHIRDALDADPEHPERESLLAWAGGSYDTFDPSTVVFDDPLKRWKWAFESQRR